MQYFLNLQFTHLEVFIVFYLKSDWDLGNSELWSFSQFSQFLRQDNSDSKKAAFVALKVV